MAFIVLM